MNLTDIARKSIESALNGDDFKIDEVTRKKFSKLGACFVTLTINGELRGCVGSLQAYRPLWEDVRENALNAAFEDSRFSPLEKGELHRIKIEVSVLSAPQKLEYKNEKDLLEKLNSKMGLILKKGFASATFLPQVWEELPDKIDFLEHLSRKAGLSKDAWKTADFEFYTVTSEKE